MSAAQTWHASVRFTSNRIGRLAGPWAMRPSRGCHGSSLAYAKVSNRASRSDKVILASRRAKAAPRQEGCHGRMRGEGWDRGRCQTGRDAENTEGPGSRRRPPEAQKRLSELRCRAPPHRGAVYAWPIGMASGSAALLQSQTGEVAAHCAASIAGPGGRESIQRRCSVDSSLFLAGEHQPPEKSEYLFVRQTVAAG